jgi:hypothetical protein
MSNVQINGFRYAFSLLAGGGDTPPTLVRPVANNYGTQLSVGDCIIPASDGTVQIAATNSAQLLGVVVGCSIWSSGRRQLQNWVPANTTFTPTTVGSRQESLVEYIPFLPGLVFEVDGAAATVTTIANQVSLIGENCALSLGAGGDTTIGVSTQSLDISTHGTSLNQFMIIGIRGYTLETPLADAVVDMDVTASRFKYQVICNQAFFPPYTAAGTIGI